MNRTYSQLFGRPLVWRAGTGERYGIELLELALQDGPREPFRYIVQEGPREGEVLELPSEEVFDPREGIVAKGGRR